MNNRYDCGDCDFKDGCIHAGAFRRLPEEEGGLGLCLKDRIENDSARGRCIWVRLPDGPLCHHLTMTEYEWLKGKFERKAAEELKTTGADHVLYGTKHYDKDGNLTTVHLGIIPLDDAEFTKRTKDTGDTHVYAVHARR
ncbi:MAG: hypothetical protein C4542_08505 [Dehalococcoidia bacterium]|nr:MAG: hypothetical protein C4542_08505 [Dehalococcoidia bacterium]